MMNEYRSTLLRELKSIKQWLIKRSARTAWSIDVPGLGIASAYIVGTDVIILRIFRAFDGRVTGWDAYKTVSKHNDVAVTLGVQDDPLARHYFVE